MFSLATKRDYWIVSLIGAVFGLLLVPVLENLKPDFWQLSLAAVIGLVAGFAIFANLALAIGARLGIFKPAIWQFTKFGAVGSLNALLDFGILNLLSLLFQIYSGGILAVFNVISVTIAVTNSYLLNRFWVFRSQSGGRQAVGEMIRFSFVTLVTILLNTAVVYFLTTVSGAPIGISEPAWENVAKLIAVPITILLNFFGYKWFVFTAFQRPKQ